MKDKRILVLLGIIVIIIVFMGTFIYQRVIFSYSLEDLMDKLNGYWVNVDEFSDCEVVIFDDDKFIRGNVNTEPNEYAYVLEKKKIKYNNYELIINIIDKNGNETQGKLLIDLSNFEGKVISLKLDTVDDEYILYEYISDNEDEVFDYCQSN